MTLGNYRHKISFVSVLVLAVQLLSGCGAQRDSASLSVDSEKASVAPSSLDSLYSEADVEGRGESPGEIVSGKAAQDTSQPTAERKIIYQADLELVVEDFDPIPDALRKLVSDANGFLADSNLDQLQGQRRYGSWTARVPVDQYDSFLRAVSKLGSLVSQQESAQDVTAQYVDLEARIDSKQQLEKRVLQLLERPDDKIQHVIEVEKELARIRSEIERMEGQLRVLSNQTSLTTVRINVREVKSYQPEQAVEFSGRVSSAWNDALTNAKSAGENFVIGLVRNAFAVIAWAVGLLVACWFVRRLWKRRANPAVAET